MPATATTTTKNTSRPKASGVRKLRPSTLLPTLTILRKLSPREFQRLQQLLRDVGECVYNQKFRAPRYWAGLAPLPPRPPENESVVLTWDEEKSLFLRFNYARYRTLKILHAYRAKKLDVAGTRDLLLWDRRAEEARARIVDYNTSLVLAMARRAKSTTVEIADMISEGNLALLRCVDKFDVERGFKFSTYACRAILAAFSRTAMKHSRHKSRFPTAFESGMERSDFLERRRDEIEQESIADLKLVLSKNAAELTTVEQRVLGARFSLGQEVQPGEALRGKTLEEVGSQLGVSKERVRQIQNEALQKLRAVMEAQLLQAS